MSQFHYRAVSDTGDILHGEMEAASVDEVIARLQDQGHTPLEARPANEAGSSGSFGGLFKRLYGLSPTQLGRVFEGVAPKDLGMV